MIIIEGRRRSGRTTSMLQHLCGREDAWLMVHTVAEKRRLERLYFEMFGAETNHIITPMQAQKLRGHHKQPQLLIDNLDLVLASMFGVVPTAVTVERT